MITEQEFLQALKTVREYQQQINQLCGLIDGKNGSKWDELIVNSVRSIRTINAIKNYYRNQGGDSFAARNLPMSYLKTIDKQVLLKINGVGFSTWSDIEDIIQETEKAENERVSAKNTKSTKDF